MDKAAKDFKNLPLREGVGIVLLNKDNKVFVAKRIDNPKNFWQMPQGGVDDGEDFLAAAYRELEEETGIMKKDITDFREVGFTNDKFAKENKHYITIFVEMKVDNDISAMNLEPEKCEKWEWYNNNNIPSEQFIPLKNYLEKYNQI